MLALSASLSPSRNVFAFRRASVVAVPFLQWAIMAMLTWNVACFYMLSVHMYHVLASSFPGVHSTRSRPVDENVSWVSAFLQLA